MNALRRRPVDPPTRRFLTWGLSVPLMFGGVEVAHWLAFRLVYSSPLARAQALRATGHGYLSAWPALAGVALALLAATFVVQVRRHASGGGLERVAAPPSPLLFALLPPLAFAMQEHVEALVHSGSITGVADAPTFLLGIALQLPFAAIAFLLARLLLRVAAIVGDSIRPPALWVDGWREPHRPAGSVGCRPLTLLGARPGRGPPLWF